ncbi:MAG: MFS transporter [Thermoplasmata archaeon]
MTNNANDQFFVYTQTQKIVTLVSAILGFALDGFNMLIFAFLLLPIAKSLNVNIPDMGFIFSLQLIFSMLGGVIFGHFADTKGRKLLLMYSIILYSIGAIFSAFSWNLASLAIFRSLTGLGLGGEWGVGMALFNEVYTSKRRAFGGGLIQGSFLLGILLAGLSAHFALSSFPQAIGWRIGMASGAISLIPVVFIRLFMPESRLWLKSIEMRTKDAVISKIKEPIWTIFKRKYIKYTLIGLLMVFAYMYSFYAVSSIMPTILGKMYKISPPISIKITYLVTIIGALTYFFTGYLGDVAGRKYAFLLTQMISIIGFVVLSLFVIKLYAPFKGSLLAWPIFWGYLLFYMGSGSFAVFGVWFSELYPTEMRSTGISFCYMVGRGTSALAPLISAISFTAGLISGLIAAILLFILPLFLQETKEAVLTPGETILPKRG